MANNLESKLQIEAVKWFRMQYPKLTIFSVPNGGKRNALTATILKREGALAGVADLFLMYPSKTYHGLFIEMKIGKGVQSEAQKEFEKQCKLFGYKYELCYTFDDFVRIIQSYFYN